MVRMSNQSGFTCHPVVCELLEDIFEELQVGAENVFANGSGGLQIAVFR